MTKKFTSKSVLLTSSCMAGTAMLLAVPVTPAQAAPANYLPCAGVTTPPPSTATDVFLLSVAADGPNGGSASSPPDPGNNGGPGDQAGDIGYNSPDAPISTIALYTAGGNGGNGSDAGSFSSGHAPGGTAGAGGVGGAVSVNSIGAVNQDANSPNQSAICGYSAGGTGGMAGLSQNNANPKPNSADGGQAGDVSVTVWNEVTAPDGGGVIAWSQGGAGGAGTKNQGGLDFGNARSAGNGQLAGDVTVVVQGAPYGPAGITSSGGAIVAIAAGGNGGDGGKGDGTGGNGGDGAAGGTINVTNGGTLSTTSDGAPGIWAQSAGGTGGAGGQSNGTQSGTGGTGAAGGQVTISLGGSITTAGQDAQGVLAQSLGGWGAPGGVSNVTAGNGGSGGAGGSITILDGGTITTTGSAHAQGIMAQSLGGGGGNGGDASGIVVTVGGAGGVSADGGAILVDTNSSLHVTTNGFRSQGLQAQSIGGGGGNGGNATSDGAPVTVAVGGTGGAGGNGGQILATSDGTLATNGDHSEGMLLQSIGGGGGNGGAGYATSGGPNQSFGLAIAFSLGGSGGAGGYGGTIAAASSDQPTNGGVIWTTGANSDGILAQSIGAGGGTGAPAVSSASVTDVGAALSFAFGGSGGVGGDGGAVTLENTGLIMAAGTGSRGMAAQSIGGGGGTGGDSKASSSASAQHMGLLFSHHHGGSGGGSGNGGSISLNNLGLIVTIGTDGDALSALSLGGGGGSTTEGDGMGARDFIVQSATLGSEGMIGNGLDVTLAHGPSTGGGQVPIITLGDGAIAMLGQSIGGGGGRIGGFAGSSQDAQFSITSRLGASSGGGGSVNGTGTGPAVQVSSYATILTYGADAPGIVAQSVGGGGGIAGKGATNLGRNLATGDGGNGGGVALLQLEQIVEQGVNAVGDFHSVQDVINLTDGMLGIAPPTSTPLPEYVNQLIDLSAVGGQQSYTDNSTTLDINLALGSANGVTTGNQGGDVNVVNDGYLATLGKMSTGVIAQSVGGGGGIVGAANMAATSDEKNASLTLGSIPGSSGNGSGGNSGKIDVEGWIDGTIMLTGSLAPGIVAQSVGGGGGIASLSGTSTALFTASDPVLVSIGGTSGTADYSTVNSANWIVTLSHDSPGIIAQSIGAGGGLVRLMASDLEPDSGQVIKAPTFVYDLKINAIGCLTENCADGSGAPVTVTNTNDIETFGDGSHGILAQSIGGGGGAVLGGLPIGSTFFGSGGLDDSHAGSVTISTGDPSNSPTSKVGGILTTGDGAVAILAQSIGGSGGLAGNLAQATTFASLPQLIAAGRAGTVDITVYKGAAVSTQGAYAPVILAQAIGDGGGLFSSADGNTYHGSLGSGGYNGDDAGTINIGIYGTVAASGVGSRGIYAESVDGSYQGLPMTVEIYSGGSVQGGIEAKDANGNPIDGSAAGIYFTNGSALSVHPNLITVDQGATLSSADTSNPVAIYGVDGWTQVVNNGTIIGNIQLLNGTGNGCFTNNGVLQSGKVDASACPVTNNGVMTVGSVNTVGKMVITGDLVQSGSGVLNIDADLKNGQADKLEITGKASMAGTVKINAMNVSNKTVTVLSATDGVTLDPQLKQTDDVALFDFPVEAVGNELHVKAKANFTDVAAKLGKGQKAVAANLQKLFDGGASMDDGFTALSKVASADVAKSFDRLGGHALGAIGAFRYASSRAFVGNLYNGCQTLDGSTCGWAKLQVMDGTQDATDDALGYKANAQVYQLGVQTELGADWYLGAAAAYEHGRFRDASGDARVSGNAMLAGASLRYQHGPLELSGALDGGYGWYKSLRNIVIGDLNAVANGRPREWQVGGHLRGAYSIALGKAAYVKPFAELNAMYVHANQFEEEGRSPFNLNVAGQGEWAVTSAVGMELGGRIGIGNGWALRPFASAALELNGAADWTTWARFADQPQSDRFSVDTAAPSKLGRFAIGADLLGSKKIDFSVSYSPEIGDHYHSDSAIARLTYRF